MSHRIRDDAADRIFHITSRVNWRAWHLADERAKIAINRLVCEAAEAFGVRVLAGVLMSNHIHLVVQSPPPALHRVLTGRRTRCRHFRPWPAGHQMSSVIAQFMKSIRYRMSIRWKKELDLSGRFWESDYDSRAIKNLTSLVARIAYDHRNPVKAGMVTRPEDYAWSSASHWATGVPGKLPISLAVLPLFDASPQTLREQVIRLHGTPQLDEIGEELEALLWEPTDVAEDVLRQLFAEHGFPPICGTNAAEQ